MRRETGREVKRFIIKAEGGRTFVRYGESKEQVLSDYEFDSKRYALPMAKSVTREEKMR